MLELVEQGLKLINSGSSATAVPIFEKIKEELTIRNKLFKLTDKSEAGWAAVDEYEQDELASDSLDDKKLRSAQARASAKKKKGKVLGKSWAKPYQRLRQAIPAIPQIMIALHLLIFVAPMLPHTSTTDIRVSKGLEQMISVLHAANQGIGGGPVQVPPALVRVHSNEKGFDIANILETVKVNKIK